MNEFSLGRFSEKGRQLQKILIELLNDDKFVRLVYNNDYTPLTTELPEDFDPHSLINTRLFTQVYRPPTGSEVVYICVFYKKVGIGGDNTYYKNTDFTVAIVVHRDLWNIDGGLRAFEIADRVDSILNMNTVTGSLSKDWFKSMRYYPIDEMYGAIELDYSNWD